MTGAGPAEPVARSWDTYWQGAEGRGAFSADGAGHPLVLDFWTAYFSGAEARFDSPRIVDIASGNGALLERAGSVSDTAAARFTCLDVSAVAVGVLRQRFPGVQGLVADARAVPVQSGSFDIAVSQFGLEYAGPEAIGEAARIVRANGELALLLHYHDGAIHRQCAANLDAVGRLRQVDLFPRAIRMFEAGFAAVRGAARGPYDSAARDLVPAIRAMESIMQTHGRHIADDHVLKLYTDVRTMHERIQYYEPADVLNWLTAMQREVDAYGGRMTSMCEAAIDKDDFEKACGTLRRAGFELVQHGPLTGTANATPLAWSLVARRAAAS